MSNQVNSLKKGLTVKDLVTTGIFSAIFFVFTLVGGLPFAPNPVLTFYMPMGAALLCGPIYLLMVANCRSGGASQSSASSWGSSGLPPECTGRFSWAISG